MRDSAAKRQKIRTAVAELLLQEGFKGVTFAKVSKRSRAAVGSINHFFGDMEGLLTSVHDEMASSLTADANAALQGYRDNWQEAVRSLISACLSWPEKFPGYCRVVGLVDAHLTRPKGSKSGSLQTHLEQVLKKWADDFIRAGAVAPLSPSQLYALVLAPAMYGSAAKAVSKSSGATIESNWIEILTAAAIRAIAPAHGKLSARSGTRRKKDPDREPHLF
jgi:AcrR family transcriptional regulator